MYIYYIYMYMNSWKFFSFCILHLIDLINHFMSRYMESHYLMFFKYKISTKMFFLYIIILDVKIIINFYLCINNIMFV